MSDSKPGTDPAPASVALTRLMDQWQERKRLQLASYDVHEKQGTGDSYDAGEYIGCASGIELCAADLDALRPLIDQLEQQRAEHAAQIATLQAEADELFAELQKTRTQREAEAKEEAVRLRLLNAMASSALATLRERVAVVEQKMRHPLWNGQRMPVSSRDVSEWADELAAVLPADPTPESK